LNFDYSLQSMFLYFEAHFSFYFTVLTNKGVPCFQKQLVQLLKSGIMERLKISRNYEESNNVVAIQFMLSAYVGVVEWWIKNKMPLSPQDVAEQLWNMLEVYYVPKNLTINGPRSK
jgi:hypothetical protein